MSQIHLRKYNELLTTAKALTFSLFEIDGIDLRTDASFATGDVTISKDGGAESNTSNLPVDEGKGYSLILTAAELSASQVRISIVDQSGTKTWLDTELIVETFANSSAMFAFDFDTASTPQTADHTSALSTIDTVVDTILVDTADLQSSQGDWATATGFNTVTPPTVSELNARTLVSANYATSANLATVDTVVDGIQTDLSNGTDGLGAIKSTVDAIPTTAMRGTDGANTTAPDNASITAILADTADLQSNQGDWLTATGFNTTTPPTVGAIADAVLDEVNTVGAHNVVNSLGRQIRSLETGSLLHSASTQAGSTPDIVVLSSSADNSDDFYTDQLLIIDGEARIILGYVGSSRSATLHRALINGAPSNNTDYEVSSLGASFAVAVGGAYTGQSVHISASGSTTAIIDRDGLDTNPIDEGSLSNARTVADAKNLDRYIMGNGSTIVLDESYENWGFAGAGSTVDCNGQSISNSRFVGVTVEGVSLDSSGGAVVYRDCRILTHTLASFTGMNHCDLVGAITLGGATTFRFKDCAPIFATGCTFNFTTGLNQNLLLLNWNDGATIQNLGNAGTDKIIVTGDGHITLEASCVGGTIEWSGDIKFTNNGSGITFVQGLTGDIVDDTNELQSDDIPTLISALNDFDPTSDDVAVVTLVDTTTTNTDMVGTDGANTTTPPTANAIADQVWDEVQSGHTTAGTFGLFLDSEVSGAGGGSAPTVAQIADGVWDELIASHTISGSTGEALGAAGGAGDPWITVLPGSYTAGQAGKIIGDNINATISSRATQSSVDTVDSNVDAILVDTSTTLDAKINDIQGATFNASTDSLEAIRNRGDAEWTTGAGGSSPTVEQIRTEMDDNSTQLSAIVADTNELQADWVNGGRLDLILDSTSTQSSVNTIDGIVDSILVDTGTTIPAQITALNNFNPASDAVANVTLVATTTTNTDMRGTNSANTVAPDNTSIASILVDTADLQANQGAWLTATGFNTTVPDNASITAILADTADLQANQGNWATATGFSTSAEIAALNDISAADVWAHGTRTITAFSFSVDVATVNSAPVAGTGTSLDLWRGV